MSGGVPPSSRARSRPKHSVSADMNKAANLYERFTGHPAEDVFEMDIPPLPKHAMFIGILDCLEYTTVRDGKTEYYRHDFKQVDKPILAVSPNGRQILVVKGNYRFTERGIVDRSDKS